MRCCKWLFSLVLLCSTPASAFTLSLQSDQWYLLSIPGGDDVVVSEIFEGQLEPSDIGDTWVILTFNAQQQAYVEQPGNSTLSPGDGFWFQQVSGSAVEFDIDVNAPTVPLTVASPCQSSFGCFEFPLPTGSGVQWSLLGTPFPEGVEVQDVLLTTDTGQCANGCTLEQASGANLAGDKIYRFDAIGNQYVTLASNDLLIAGESYWVATTIAQSVGSARLVIPTYCTPFT